MMSKKKMYSVIAIVGASFPLGKIEASSEEEAIEKLSANAFPPSLCWECSRHINIGEVFDFEVEEAE
jgi:hypothetical protein